MSASQGGKKSGKHKGRGRGRGTPGQSSDQTDPVPPRHTGTPGQSSDQTDPVPPRHTVGSTIPSPESRAPGKSSAQPQQPTSKTIFASRPGKGLNGKPISVTVNHFPVHIGIETLFHYDVEVELDRSQMEPSRFPVKPVPMVFKREVMNVLFNRDRKLKSVCPAYDGNKNIFTCGPIEGIGGFMNLTVNLPNNNRTNTYKVKIQPVQKEGQSLPALNLSMKQSDENRQTAIMSLDVVLRHGSQQKLVSNGKAFYCKPNDRQCVLSDGKVLWSGFFQSLRPDENQTVLIVNKTSAIFYPECSVLNYVQMTVGKPVQGMKKLAPDTISKLNRELREVRFTAEHLESKRTFKCDGVTRETAREITFTREVDGNSITMSVDDYFRETYFPLKFPLFPCLKVAGKFFPMETATIPSGQMYKNRLEDKHRSESIKMTIALPERSLENIKYFVEQIRKNASQEMKAYKLTLDSTPMTVCARVIDAPPVTYKDGKTYKNVYPREGSWNLRNMSFFEPGRISNWVVWCTDEKTFKSRAVEEFAARFCNAAKRMGIWLNDPLNIAGRPVRNVLSDLSFFLGKTLECTKGSKLDFLLIVLPNKDDNLYAEIKYVAEIKLGLMTQCLLSKNVESGGDPMLICNVLQKVNSKIGGRNCSLFPPNEPLTMFMGADVNHAGPRDREKKSIAAVVASVDSQGNRYVSHVREQINPADAKHHLEMIGGITDTVKSFLNLFNRNVGKYPERIIYYRDGVSEGEFADLLNKEVGDIRAACRELKIPAKLTVIVVAKRHHTRLFPTNPNDGVGRKYKNVPPGTVVDSVIVHPVYYDFYLCSHFGIQGLSRPTHYTVLVDDSRFSADNLQKMTYYLCHMSARCTRAESIPTPVKYAHLTAFRSRFYAIHQRKSMPDAESDDEDDNPEAVSEMREQVVPLETMQKQMYFV